MSIRERPQGEIGRITAQDDIDQGDPSQMAADELRQLVPLLSARQKSLEQENAKLRRISREKTRSQEEVLDLYDRSPVGDLSLNAAGAIVRANATAETLLGVVRSSLVGSPFLSFVNPDQQDVFMLHWSQAAQTAPQAPCILGLRRSDGSRCDVQVLSATDQATPNGGLRMVLIPVGADVERSGLPHRHDAIRQAVSFAAKILLRTSAWQRHTHEILERLGRAAHASRVFLCENERNDTGKVLARQHDEWLAPELVSTLTGSPQWNLEYHRAGLGRWADALGRGEVVIAHVAELAPQEAAELDLRRIRSLVVLPVFVGQEWWGFLGLGESREERVWSAADIDSLKTATGTLGAAIQREQTERTLLESERRYRSIFNGVEVSIWEQDYSEVLEALHKLKMSGVDDLSRYLQNDPEAACELASLIRVNDVNEATLRLFEARDKQELIAAPGTIFAASSRQLFVDVLCAIAEGRSRFRAETRCRTLGGRELTALLSMPIPRSDSGFQHVTLSLLDITERKQQEEQIWRQANYDALTGLPNRTLFMHRLAQTVNDRRRSNEGGALMFIDLDRFKWVNDNLGHAAGDDLLRQVAGRLSRCVRESDVVSRLAGDEFTIILSDVTESSVAGPVAEKVLAALARPFRLQETREIRISGSIGVTFCPADSSDLDTLLRYADAAMYRAKAAGANTYRFFRREEDTTFRKQLPPVT